MKLELQYPYTQDFCRAYLSRSNTDQRQRVTLYREDGTGTMTAYARYLLAVKIGRYLTDDEEADHIDNDCTNDNLDNIQMLSVEEHLAKTLLTLPAVQTTLLTCSFCKKNFIRSLRDIKSRKTENVCCSHSCNGKMAIKLRGHPASVKMTRECLLQAWIMKNSGVSTYKLENRFQISRGSFNYWFKLIKADGLSETLDRLT